MPDRAAVSRAEPDPAGAAAAPAPAVSPSSDVAVACENVSLAYGARTVLRDVTFAVRRGERAAVLGPNGGALAAPDGEGHVAQDGAGAVGERHVLARDGDVR